MKKVLLIVFAICFMMAGTASADTFDFTGSSYSAALGMTTFTDANGITFDPAPAPPSTLWWDNEDGFGVQQYGYEPDALPDAYQPDEIEGSESLMLSFATPFVLETIFITDLFVETNNNYTGPGDDYQEIGYYKLDEADPFKFLGILPTEGSNGERVLNIGGVTVSSIIFTAPGILVDGSAHEFAVQGIAGNSVPIPGSALLLVSGLIGLIGFRTRFRK